MNPNELQVATYGVLSDIRRSLPLKFGLTLDGREGAPDRVVGWFERPGELGRVSIWVMLGDSQERQIASVADQISEHVVETLWWSGVPCEWPACPVRGHRHPLVADLVNGEAWWLCPTTRGQVDRVGSLSG